MMEDMEKPGFRKTFLRIVIFLCGHIILALGLTLNTKINLGVAPIISVAYSVAQIWNLDFANTTFCWFSVLILVQIVLLLIKRTDGWKKKSAIVCLQFAANFISTRFIALFTNLLPVFDGSIPGRLLLMILAIILTGTGASMSLFTRIVPNPGDGVVQGISDFTGIRIGTTKNLFDTFCVCITLTISLVFTHSVIGIGIGTLATLLGVGRVVALFDRVFGSKIRNLVVVPSSMEDTSGQSERKPEHIESEHR